MLSIETWGEVDIEAREDVSLHCTELGNYETLQCDLGLCWCVHPRLVGTILIIYLPYHHIPVSRTGSARSKAVPESVVSVLPCFPSINATLET